MYRGVLLFSDFFAHLFPVLTVPGPEVKIKGCHDFTGPSLEALSLIKALLFIGLYAAGVNVVGVAAFGNSAIAALVGEAPSKTVLYGAPLRPADLERGVLGKVLRLLFPVALGLPIPHFKYVAPTCVLNDAVLVRMAKQMPVGGDTLGGTSAVLALFALSAAHLILLYLAERDGVAAMGPSLAMMQETV